MRARTIVGVALLGIGLVTVAGVALAVGRVPSLLARLRSLPEDFSAAYHQREAELRAALLPGEEDVAAARATRSRERGGRPAAPGAFDEDDDLSYGV
ncbi:MAG: hypothetical protein ACYC1Z_02215 [Georgenia sp.]